MVQVFTVWAAAGCGKTTFCTRMIERLVENGDCAKEQILYSTFAREAAADAAIRIGLTSEERRQMWFRTLHSVCFRLLGVRKGQVVTPQKLREFGTQMGVEINADLAVEEDEAADLAKVILAMERVKTSSEDSGAAISGILAMYQHSRLTAANAQELLAARYEPSPSALAHFGGKDWSRYPDVVEEYQNWKGTELYDFVDMLEMVLLRPIPLPRWKFVFIDECLPAGTLISMADGTKKAIETIGCGEKVLGFDHETGALRPASVVETRSSQAEKLVRINDRLSLTPNHPVFVVGRGYIEAGLVQVGDRIVHEKRINTSHAGVPNLQGQFRSGAVLCRQEILFQGMRERLEDEASHPRCLPELRQSNILSRLQANQVLLEKMCLCEHQEAARSRLDIEGDPFQESCLTEKDLSVYMRGMRERIYSDGWAEWRATSPILQSKVCGACKIHARGAEETVGSYETQESDEGSCCPIEDQYDLEGEGICGARRERSRTHCSSGKALGGAWRPLVGGDCYGDRWYPWLEVGKAGPIKPRSQDCGGMRRAISQHVTAKGDRPTEGGRSSAARIRCHEIQERQDSGGVGFGYEVDTVRSVEEIVAPVRVFNIGTETENYFAEEILVHNCQDLSQLQWAVVDRLSQVAQSAYYVGDDYQAIMSFQGASAESFLSRRRQPGSFRLALPTTHRFGDNIIELGRRIVSGLPDSEGRVIYPARPVHNPIRRIWDVSEAEDVPGSKLWLHRHKDGCNALANHCIMNGIPFWSERGVNPLAKGVEIAGFKAISRLVRGEYLDGSEAGDMAKVLRATKDGVKLVKRGSIGKLEAMEAGRSFSPMDIVSAHFTDELWNALRAGDWSVTDIRFATYYQAIADAGWELGGDVAPDITITTIHGSKGRDAESVLLWDETLPKCLRDPNERRVAYVAATRTKGPLYIVSSPVTNWRTENYPYPIEGISS